MADAMVELGREDLALDWALRGIADIDGWQIAGLYDVACEIHAGRGEPLEVLRLRRAEHERMASSSTYERLRRAADAVDAWPLERDAARLILRERDRRGLVEALLRDGADQLAWEAATAISREEVGTDLWLRLAHSREPHNPAEALAVYERLADETLATADRRSYATAIRILKKARAAATAAGTAEAFSANMTRLREIHRRRPTLIAMLDKAGMR